MTEKTTVLVTGSGGLLGRHICAALRRDHHVVGLDLHPPEDDEEQAGDAWVQGDLTDDDSVADALDTVRERFGPRLASVVHLAAYYDFSGEPSPLYEDLTVKGTARLLRALREKCEVEQFVFSSSMLVAKPAEEGKVLDESCDERAEWDYPRSKLEAERVLRAERDGIPAVVLRIAGCYDEDCHSIPIGQQIRRIHEKKLESLFFPGDPGHGQSFVHVEDVAECVRLAVAKRAELEVEETFVVGEPEWCSYADLQDRIGELVHGKEWPTIRIPAPVAKAGAWLKERMGDDEQFIKPWMIDLADGHYPVDPSKAVRVLGWRPEHRLVDVLPEMISRLKDDPDRFYEENGLARETAS